MRAILEALVAPTTEGDANALAERAARRCTATSATSTRRPARSTRTWWNPAIEETLRDRGPGDGDRPNGWRDPRGVKRIAGGGQRCSSPPDVRRTLRKLCEGAFPEVAVLTYGELDTGPADSPGGPAGHRVRP